VDATGTAYTNPFFNTVPPGSFPFAMAIAVLAAIVASQAMITSTFQLLSQVMRMSYFPHIKVVHTSRTFHQHMYMPLANWLMMIGTVVVVVAYRDTTSLGNAYGACVIVVTAITTCSECNPAASFNIFDINLQPPVVSLVAILVWRLPALLVAPVFLVFLALDGAYLSAVLTKVPEGAWFTFLLALLLSSVFILWRFGKEAQWRAEAGDRVAPAGLLTSRPSTDDEAARRPPTPTRLTDEFGGLEVSTVPGLGVFFDKKGEPEFLPPSFSQFVRKFAARPRVVVFFHMRPLPVPSVPAAERYVVTRVRGVEAAYAVVLRHGYMDDV
jgi:KUP system potassium uptake protein